MSVAVDADSHIYTIDLGGQLRHFDESGIWIESLTIADDSRRRGALPVTHTRPTRHSAPDCPGGRKTRIMVELDC